MEFISEFFVEFFIEIFCEGVLSVGTEIVPYKKLPEAKRKKYKAIAVVTTFVLFVLLMVGGAMLLETKGKSDLGKVLIGFPIVYFVTGIVLKIYHHLKRKSF